MAIPTSYGHTQSGRKPPPKQIEARGYNLKAVNPHARNDVADAISAPRKML